MTSRQSPLEDRDIAEQLAETQRQISIAEFFEKNKQMLGFDSEARALVTTVKEGVDNALDATEEAGFLPDIYIEIRDTGNYYTVIVEDNGPGITKDQIPNIFGKLLYGSRFHVREQSLTPDQLVLIRRNGTIEFVPIGVLCDAYLPRTGPGTAPIPDEIEVPSFNRNTHEMTWEPVTTAIRHETDEPTYEITTERGRTVEVTGNHSLFGLTASGETTELKAADLEPGDSILAPQTLPRFEDHTTEVNILEHLPREELDGRRLYVYGFDPEVLEELRSDEVTRRKASADSSRERYFYEYNGVEILRDSVECQYIEKGFLPAELVVDLGWEEKAADCELRTYKVGGEVTSIPVTIPLTSEFVELVAHYISEGHVDDRQAGFTFGSHETDLVEATERAIAGIGGSTTTIERERNSTRVKAFGSPIVMLLRELCGSGAANKRIPAFIFEADPARQRDFLRALYRTDGTNSHPKNILTHVTVSETLARQVSTLWNMLGVLASTEIIENLHGYTDTVSTVYKTKVYGEDVELIESRTTSSRPQRYKRIPTSLVEDLRVGNVDYTTVPDTIPGLLTGVGIGSDFEHAEVYESVIEDALAGEYVDKPRYVHNLKEKGLLDEQHQPTDKLETVWTAIQNLQGITGTDMCLLPVTNIEETDSPEYVYDISVPGATGVDENFIVVNDGAVPVKNSRGQQGIGISAAVLYAQLTSGKPAKITSRTPSGEDAQYFELIIDTENNEPEVREESTAAWDRPHGTRIELQLEANMRARRQLHDYIRHTAVVNPHARIELVEPDASFKADRGTDELPDETEAIRPHPHGVELGTLLKMLEGTDSYSLSGFLQGEFTRVGGKTAGEILDRFRDEHFGREMPWDGPRAHDDDELEAAVVAAVANKSAEATEAFAADVAAAVDDRAPVAHHEVVAIVDDAADAIEERFDTVFGATVRDNAISAAWEVVTADRVTRLYELVDDATTDRKDDEVIRGVADRLASKFESGPARDRVTRDTVRAFIDRSADMLVDREDASFGETARTNVLEAVWGSMVTVPDSLPSVRSVASDRDTAADLLAAMRGVDVMAPPTECLAPIRADLIEAGLRKEFDADYYTAVTRDAEVHGGDPFIVEAGIAYGGELEEDRVGLMRFANRVPLVYQQGACAITDVIRDIDWRNYGLDQPGGSGLPNGPAVVLVHVASTNVPFTSESKDAVANIPAIEKESELAVREAARGLKTHLNQRRSLEQRRRKQNVIADILPSMAEKVAAVTGRESPPVAVTLARIMNNVLVTRRVDDGTVELRVENHTGAGVELDVTEITSAEPVDVSGGTRVDMDEEWFIKWTPHVGTGETVALSYQLDGAASEASFDVTVDGVEPEKLTIHQ